MLVDFAENVESESNLLQEDTTGLEITDNPRPAVRRSNFLLRAFGKRSLF